jgi:alkylated DNA repair dioxygenase AlkB
MEYCLQENLIDPSHEFNQCIINKYEPGQGINKHIDIKAYGPVIGCFTFGSGAVMTFRRKDEVHHLYVKPNSLYIMSGESRLLWTHEMPSRKSDMVEGKKIPRGLRISVTFRHVPK